VLLNRPPDAAATACYNNGVAATFHGWLGTSVVDSYGMRALQFALHTVHDAGVAFPKHVPNSAREAIREARSLASRIIGGSPLPQEHVQNPT
jgi:hypothetical protein